MATSGEAESGNESCVININEPLIRILGNELGESSNVDDTILLPKVPQMLRENESNQKCYVPMVVSIGPYHHGNKKLKLGEKLKIPLARQYLDGIAVPKKEIEEIEDIARKAREYYAEESTKGLDDETFVRMMLLDGCFLLQFIYCLSDKDQGMSDQLKKTMKSHDIAFVKRDLFLLENQLPFEVLELLMRKKFEEKEEGIQMLEKFLKDTRALPLRPAGNRFKVKFKNFFKSRQNRNSPPAARGEKSKMKNPAHLLDLMWTQLIDSDGQAEAAHGNDWYTYRSAQELKKAGIHFRPSTSHRFTDVKFEPELYRAVLRLPPMTIDDATKTLLLNLVAYEMSPKGPETPGVTSYLWFIDSIIDSVEDVKELRQKGILLNFLGSDQQVADLFNEIGSGLVPDHRAYASVKLKIEGHYTDSIKVCFAEWWHTYFNRPWTLLASGAAIFGLFLSSVQTYNATFQHT